MRKKIYIFAFILFLIDILSKVFILNANINMPFQIIDNFFSIDKVTNTGAAFSILSGWTLLFVLIAIIVLFYIDRYIIKDVDSFLPLGLIVAGIIGNMFDRIVYGEVIDFLSFRFGSYYFPVFNLADAFICIGVFLLIIEYVRRDKDGFKS